MNSRNSWEFRAIKAALLIAILSVTTGCSVKIVKYSCRATPDFRLESLPQLGEGLEQLLEHVFYGAEIKCSF